MVVEVVVNIIVALLFRSIKLRGIDCWKRSLYSRFLTSAARKRSPVSEKSWTGTKKNSAWGLGNLVVGTMYVFNAFYFAFVFVIQSYYCNLLMNFTFRNIQSSAGCPWGYVHKQYRDIVEKEKIYRESEEKTVFKNM